MATHQISIFGALRPDTTGRAFFEPYDVKATNDLYKHFVAVFNDPSAAQAHGFYGRFLVPQNYVGSAAFIPVWTSTATTGNCRWRMSYRTIDGDDTTSLDQASHEEQVLVTDAAPGAANRRLTPSLSPTAGNFAAGETVEFLLERLDDSGVDTMAAAAMLHDLIFQYADT